MLTLFELRRRVDLLKFANWSAQQHTRKWLSPLTIPPKYSSRRFICIANKVCTVICKSLLRLARITSLKLETFWFFLFRLCFVWVFLFLFYGAEMLWNLTESDTTNIAELDAIFRLRTADMNQFEFIVMYAIATFIISVQFVVWCLLYTSLQTCFHLGTNRYWEKFVRFSYLKRVKRARLVSHWSATTTIKTTGNWIIMAQCLINVGSLQELIHANSLAEK